MQDRLNFRRFGETDIEIGALGLGTWAMGGPWTASEDAHYPAGTALGYGDQDDSRSLDVLAAAIDHGIRLIDTAPLYGCGHAERLVGRAIAGKRDRVFVATRFGHSQDPESGSFTGVDTSTAAIRNSLESSLRNLSTDHVDLFQLHVEFHSLQGIDDVFDEAERLVAEGKVRFTGWSTNYPARLQAVARRESVQSAQFDLNVFQDSPDMLEVCDAAGLTAIARLPLAMGFLTGKFSETTVLPANDVRAGRCQDPESGSFSDRTENRFWLRHFGRNGAGKAEWMSRLQDVREVLTEGGRNSLAQGALRWIFARHPGTVAIPGARSVEQLAENVGALEFGPLSEAAMQEIETLLERDRHPAALYLRPHRPAA